MDPIRIGPNTTVADRSSERLLALDVGSRRIGLAMSSSDPSLLTPVVQPLFTMERKGDRPDLKSIARVVRKHGITALIVGHPLRLSGDKSAQTLRVEGFADELRVALALPVFLHDERLSTVAAHEQLDHTCRDRTGQPSRHAVIDQVAAVVILEGFLAHRAHLEAMVRVRAEDLAIPDPDPQP